MKVRRIGTSQKEADALVFKAPKIKGNIASYYLWIDERERLYVEIFKSDSGGKLNKQTLLSVTEYASMRETGIKELKCRKYHIDGDGVDTFSIDDNKLEPIGNNNIEPFFRAILQHLIDGQIKK